MKDEKQKAVEDWLLEGKTITQREAVKLCDSYRLSGIINILRKKHNIKMTRKKSELGCSYGEYELIPKKVLNAMTECYECVHKGGVCGSCHSSCSNPDPDMTGNPHGIRSGWFLYPFDFDPVWKTKMCSNFLQKGGLIEPNRREN